MDAQKREWDAIQELTQRAIRPRGGIRGALVSLAVGDPGAEQDLFVVLAVIYPEVRD